MSEMLAMIHKLQTTTIDSWSTNDTLTSKKANGENECEERAVDLSDCAHYLHMVGWSIFG